MALGEVSLGKMLLVLGGGLLLIGFLIWLSEKFGIPLGRLPGDIHIEGAKGSFYFPIVTCVLVSVVVSLLLTLLKK